jgi:hypothetical protein
VSVEFHRSKTLATTGAKSEELWVDTATCRYSFSSRAGAGQSQFGGDPLQDVKALENVQFVMKTARYLRVEQASRRYAQLQFPVSGERT